MSDASGSTRDAGPRKFAYNIEAAREREMHLYLPYWGFSQSEKFAQQSVGHSPNVSRDNVLTVFAQLASLRLNAKRALISLFDRTTQYVVAEATPELGLRRSEGGKKSNNLWLGAQQLPREHIPMCNQAMNLFTEKSRDIFIVPDLTQDPRFQSHTSVTGSPYHRFYVSVPIQSPDSYVIGSIAVLDDSPREGLGDEQTELLQELSATVMEHLLSQRAMREEYREEKMVRALGLFVNGKSDLNEGIYSRDWADDRTGEQLAHVNRRLGEIKSSEHSALNRDSDLRGRGSKESKASPNSSQPENTEGTRSRSPVHKFKTEEGDSKDADGEKEENKQRPRLSPTTSQLQKSLAPSNVQSVLNRASCLMNQALDVEGAMFIDASVYARRQMIGLGDDSQSDPNLTNTAPGSEGSRKEEGHPQSTSEDDAGEPKSLVLGYSTSSASSRDTNHQQSHYISLPGSFVNHLIDQYPRGKIFHIEGDGSIALSYEGLADDVSQAYVSGEKRIQAGSPKEKDIMQETSDIKHFRKVLPEARCIAIYPVWDFQRSRWFTVSLAWANDPGRVLSEPKDLTYMAAFSNSVMAEVSRLDLEAADRAKGDFISSISHELRSPLHGVLGTVELLQETVTTYTQRGLVETVYSCGRTLLDTLNHLLDYAKINTLTASAGSFQPAATDDGDSSRRRLAVPGRVSNEDLSALVQEVVEGLLAGAEFYNRETNNEPGHVRQGERNIPSPSAKNDAPGDRMMTIVDVEWQDNWKYPVYAGAWRRVVMNLFGNALKYTKSGYIRLLMKQDALTMPDKSSAPAVRITISDSGRGMSKDFLLHHLYIPFLQEDTQSPGLGVGLHLVRQIVKSLDGRIDFRSEPNRGTDVDVIIPITPAEPDPSSQLTYRHLKQRLHGKTVSLFTKSFERGEMGIGSEVFNNIRSSLSRMVTDWFHLQVLSSDELDTQRADFLIVTEHEYRTLARQSGQSDVKSLVESQSSFPLIVLSGQASSWRVVKESNQDEVIFLSQPVSPKTLATVFEYCLDQEDASERLVPHYGPSSELPLAQDGMNLPIRNANMKNCWSVPQDQILTDKSTRSDLKGNKSPVLRQQGPREIPKEVLLVEDNHVNLKIIETCVKNAGFSYQTATNGLEALEKFKARRFDAVMMDISMPVMDGLSATREMRHFEKSKNLNPTTIIILTAVLSADTQQEAVMSGVNEFFTKPTPLKQVRALLQNLPRLGEVSHREDSLA